MPNFLLQIVYLRYKATRVYSPTAGTDRIFRVWADTTTTHRLRVNTGNGR